MHDISEHAGISPQQTSDLLERRASRRALKRKKERKRKERLNQCGSTCFFQHSQKLVLKKLSLN